MNWRNKTLCGEKQDEKLNNGEDKDQGDLELNQGEEFPLLCLPLLYLLLLDLSKGAERVPSLARGPSWML